MEPFHRIAENEEERMLLEQFATFHMKKESILELQRKPMQ